jgi:Ca-activated chloride channel family protein
VIEFLHVEVFYMMLAPLVLLIILVLTSSDNMKVNFSKETLDKLRVGNKAIDKTTRNGLLFFTLVLFIFALSRPVIDKKEQELHQNLIPIVVALDVSKSMMATDIYPNRISLAKKKLNLIIQKAKNATIGILLFAKDSFILSPVTEDFISLKYIVDNLDTNQEFNNGSNIFATLEATSHMLSEFKVKNLIILSDGGNDNDYEKELEFANQNDIAIYSVGLATSNGAPIPSNNGYLTNKDGNIVTVKLNESIKNLSLKTGGGYIDFTLDGGDIDAIIARINKQSQKEELQTQKVKTYTELFYYPLGLGVFTLLLSLISIPNIKLRGTNNALLVFVLFSIFSYDLQASIFEFENIKNATKYYKEKKYKEASNEYRKVSKSPQSYYNLANSLYKQEKYQEAIDMYSKVVTEDNELESKKLHNIGNSYVKSNNLEKAKEFYEKALKLKEDKQTRQNLDLVNKELEKKKQDKNKDIKDQKNQDEKKNKNKKDQDKKKDGQKNDKDKQNKDQSKKNDEKNKDKKENQEQSNKQDKAQDNKDKTKKEDKNKKDASNVNEAKEYKKEELSDMEEKKYMKMLRNQKTPILLRKAQTKKESTHNDTQPW